MRRVPTLRRRLFASVSVLSLILCLATVGLWVRSYRVNDSVYYTSHGTTRLELWLNPGKLSAFLGHERFSIAHPDGWTHHSFAPHPEPEVFILEYRSWEYF